MFCPKCGAQIPDNSKVCNVCNTVIKSVYDNSSKAQRRGPEIIPIPAPEKSKANVAVVTIGIIVGAILLIAVLISAASKALKEEFKEKEPQVEAVVVEDAATLGVDNLLTDVSASSELDSMYGYYYGSSNLLDKDNSTAWSEGVSGDGIGESITFDLYPDCQVTSIKIKPGYCKDETLYFKNNRPKKVEIKFDNGKTIVAHLADVYNAYQEISVSDSQGSSSVTVTVLEVYSGSDFQDTCISDIIAQ